MVDRNFLIESEPAGLKKSDPKRKKRETGGPRYYRQVNEPGAL